MRGKAIAAALTAAVGVMLGCHHDKRNISPVFKEECVLPPDQARYNNPPSAEYRKRPIQKAEETLVGGRGKMGGPLDRGGF